MTSVCPEDGKGASGTHLQEVQQGRDVRDLAEVVDDLQTRVDLLITELGARRQRAILSAYLITPPRFITMYALAHWRSARGVSQVFATRIAR